MTNIPEIDRSDNISGQRSSRGSKLEYPVIFVPGMALDHPENWFVAIRFLEKFANAKKGKDIFTVDNDRSNPAVTTHLLQAKKLAKKVNSLRSGKVNLVFFSNSYFTFTKYLLESGIVRKAGSKYVFNSAKAKKISSIVLFSPSPEGGIIVNYCINNPGLAEVILKSDDKNLYIPIDKPYISMSILFKPDFSQAFKDLRKNDKSKGYVNPLVGEGDKVFAALPHKFRKNIHIFMGSEGHFLFSSFIPGSDDGALEHDDVFAVTKGGDVKIENDAPVSHKRFKGANIFLVKGRNHGGSRELSLGVSDIFYKLLTSNVTINSRVIRPYNDGKYVSDKAYVPIISNLSIEDFAVNGNDPTQAALTQNHAVSLTVLLFLLTDEDEKVCQKALLAVKKRIKWDGKDILEELREMVEDENIKTKNKDILKRKKEILQAAKMILMEEGLIDGR